MSDIRTPDEIERELEANREGLQGTLRALESTFSPDTIFRSITDSVGRHGGDFGKSAMDAARGNPLALGLTAVGLGWLMFGKGPSADRLDQEARQAMNGKDRHGTSSDDPAAGCRRAVPCHKAQPEPSPRRNSGPAPDGIAPKRRPVPRDIRSPAAHIRRRTVRRTRRGVCVTALPK